MAKTFKVKIITLREVMEKEVTSLKLRDESGFFGIMAGHTDFFTILEPGLGTYRDHLDKTYYFAVDGGFLRIERGKVVLAVYEFFEGASPEELYQRIFEVIEKRREREEKYRKLISEMEETFLKRALEIYRG